MIDINAIKLHLQSLKDKRKQSLIRLGKDLQELMLSKKMTEYCSLTNISQPNKKRRRWSTVFEIPQPKKTEKNITCVTPK